MSSTSSIYRPKRPRRFAPLNPDKGNEHKAPRLRGIIFDVDGTLCLPQNYMFGEMRSALGIPKSVDIIDHIHSLSPESDQPDQSSPQSRAHTCIRLIESTAMTSQRPQPGLVELMAYLTSRSIPKALCTRNFPLPVHHLLDTFLPGEVFDSIITRETKGVRPKPSPEGLWKISECWKVGSSANCAADSGVDPLNLAKKTLGTGVIMVGDSIDDMTSGYRAGAATVLLVHEENESLVGHEYTDLGIRRLDDLIEILEEGFVGGKENWAESEEGV